LKYLSNQQRCILAPASITTSRPASALRHAAVVAASRRLSLVRAGDFMLAYHLMDFSRYFFDQSNIGRRFFR